MDNHNKPEPEKTTRRTITLPIYLNDYLEYLNKINGASISYYVTEALKVLYGPDAKIIMKTKKDTTNSND